MTANASDDDDDEPLSSESPELRDAIDEVLRGVAHAPPVPPPVEPASGSRWGRFVIDRKIGRGGMGTVYLATDSLLGRQVALKVLDAGDQPESEVRRKRLVREARMAAGVEHERIARVYDVGEHADTTFVAMEYVRGVNLRVWMKQAHEPGEILDVCDQIAEGLAVLHRAGVIHRDLKPENVMLAEAGGVKLLDFGLAGQVVPEMGAGVGGANASTFQGTPGYISPEQYKGGGADARADVFALGVMVFELVTGERPFPPLYGDALTDALRSNPPRCDGDAWKRYPAGLAAITARMLDVDRDARLADGAEVGAALRALPRARRTWRTWLAVGAAVIVVGVTGLAVVHDRAPAQAHREPPPGMVLIDEGELDVGQTHEAVIAQCKAIGPKCTSEPTDPEARAAVQDLRRVLGYQEPRTHVEVAPFYLDIHEVTNREMVALLNRTGSALTTTPDDDPPHARRYVRFQSGAGPRDPFLLDLTPISSGIEETADQHYRVRDGRGEWPVMQVTWAGAEFYCKSQGKRLPTENEWEAAARGHDDREYPWGSEAPRCHGVVIPNDPYQPVPGCPSAAGPVDVMTSTQDVTPQGVHDLGGNVAEWVSTAFDEAGRDRGAESGGPETPRVIRGGSWGYSFPVHTSQRNKRPGNTAHQNVGFRCATNY